MKNHPNDVTRMEADDSRNEGFNNPIHLLADWMQFTLFMQFLDGPKPVPLTASAERGRRLFGTDPQNPGIGCFACHTPTMTTAAHNDFEVLQHLPVNMYSDMLLHQMGPRLADQIVQGAAQGDMFRTTPLWGIGQRIFFMHDGRTSDLLQAIRMHAVRPEDDPSTFPPGFPQSEATTVIQRFNALSPADKQAVLDFVRSL